VPNQPKTPVAAYRIPDALRARLKERAVRENKTETAVVIEALEAHLEEG